MLDPREQAKNGFRAAADRHTDRMAARHAQRVPPVPRPVAPSETPRWPRPSLAVELPDAPAAIDTPASLARLYDLFDSLASGRSANDGSELHAAILARLASNRRHAEDAGWTSFTLERDTGSGRLRLVGFAPSAAQRTIVPDWTNGGAADAAARRTESLHTDETQAADDPTESHGA